MCSYSQKISVWPLVEDLVAKGHDVTFLSPYRHKTPNPKVREFNPKSLEPLFEANRDGLIESRSTGSYKSIWVEVADFGLAVCDIMLKDPEVLSWMNNPSTKIDLVIYDSLYNECGIGLAYKFKAKYILFSTSTVGMWYPDMLGHDAQTSWIPDVQHHFETPMNFIQRLHTTVAPLYWHFWVRCLNFIPKLDAILRKNLALPEMPSIQELEINTSLVFLGSHYTTEYARSLPPFYVPVGGMHITESNKALPKDLAKFMDESGPDGVVFVSFGTYAKASTLPAETLSTLYQVFGSFKSTRFIWKFDIDRPKDMPENIITVNWAPQQEILAHKKTRGFISHGGLLSTTESIYFGVPILVFPLFADQDYNANLVEKAGCGIKVEIVGLTKKVMQDALTKILKTESYRNRVKEASIRFKDRETKPLATALWWTEYVLRHKDTTHLKPLSIHQTWYERRLLDVWFFIFFVATLILSTVFFISYKCTKTIFCTKKSEYVYENRGSKKKRS
jgi:glucuronosyltransferase